MTFIPAFYTLITHGIRIYTVSSFSLSFRYDSYEDIFIIAVSLSVRFEYEDILKQITKICTKTAVLNWLWPTWFWNKFERKWHFPKIKKINWLALHQKEGRGAELHGIRCTVMFRKRFGPICILQNTDLHALKIIPAWVYGGWCGCKCVWVCNP